MKLRVLSADDVRQALPMSAAVEAMKQAFAALSSGAADMPQRLRVSAPEVEGMALFKPASLPGALGSKIVTVFPGNRQRGLPLIYGLVVMLDPTTGAPTALLDGTFLTAWRTGAASGAATDLLARPEARRAAILGCGAQAQTQALAIDTVRDLDVIRVYGPTRSNLEQFVEAMAPQLRARLEAASSSAEAVVEAEIICAATTSSEPVFDGRGLVPGCHINGVGSYSSTMQEVDLETVHRSRVFVDQRSAVREEAGDLVIAAASGRTHPNEWIELGEVVSGAHPGRQSPDDITFFKSVGVAVQDVEAGARVLARARELGLGAEIEI